MPSRGGPCMPQYLARKKLAPLMTFADLISVSRRQLWKTPSHSVAQLRRMITLPCASIVDLKTTSHIDTIVVTLACRLPQIWSPHGDHFNGTYVPWSSRPQLRSIHHSLFWK